MRRIISFAVIAASVVAVLAPLPAQPPGNWGNLPYLTQVKQSANQLFYHVEQLRVFVSSFRNPQAGNLQRLVEPYYQDVLNFTRTLQRNPAQPQVQAEYRRIDRRGDEIVAALRAFPPTPQSSQLQQFASRIEFADQQLGAAVNGGGTGPIPGGDLVRLTKSLDAQSDDLLRLARESLRNDPVARQLERLVRAFSTNVDQFRRGVEGHGLPAQIQQGYATVLISWNAVVQLLVGQQFVQDATALRQSAARINTLVATLGRLVNGGQPLPPGPGPLPPVPPINPDRRRALYAIGADAGGGSRVRVFQANPPAEIADFIAYNPDFRGGVRVALGDVDGDGVRDIITAPGRGAPPVVRIFSGRDLSLIREFMAFDGNYRNGVWVAAADLTRNGRADVVCGADVGGLPIVRVFDAVAANKLAEFAAYEPGFRGGVRVAVGDINGDGVPDIITAPGPGRPATIRIFDGRNAANVLNQFDAYAPGWVGGAFVAAGEFNQDGRKDIITGADAGGGPQVRLFEGLTGRALSEFFAFDQAFRGGVRVAGRDIDGDGIPDLICASGPGATTTVRIFSGRNGQLLNSFEPFESWWAGGAFVGCK